MPSVQAVGSCQACDELVREDSLICKRVTVCVCVDVSVCVCVSTCPVDTLRFNLITAGVMERERGAATDGLNRMEGRLKGKDGGIDGGAGTVPWKRLHTSPDSQRHTKRSDGRIRTARGEGD